MVPHLRRLVAPRVGLPVSRERAAPRPQNVANLMDALRRSIAEEKASSTPPKKGRKRIEGQGEILLPIAGNAKKVATATPSGGQRQRWPRQRRRNAERPTEECRLTTWDRLPDPCSIIPAQVRNSQNPTCVGDAARCAMIENIRNHPYTRAVCLETARLFEHRAAKHLVEAQDWADQGVANSALEFQTKARLAQQRARTPGTYVRETPPTKQRARDRNERD